jgi:hypothetical protein
MFRTSKFVYWGADNSQWPFTQQAVADFFRSDDLLLVCPDAEPGAAANGEGT